MKIYELAQTLKEAKELRDAGFGYQSRKEAEEARAEPGIDPFYRNQLKVFALELPDER